MNQIFKLPIEYDKYKKTISQKLNNDLELITVNENNETSDSIYNIVFQPQTSFGTKMLENWSKYYTTNKSFLKDSKKIYNKLKCSVDQEKINVFYNAWNDMIQDSTFKQKFQYINWKRFNFLNNYELFLQGMSMYNLTSPFFSLLFPLVILIVPFFILKIMGKPITFEFYKQILFSQLKNHTLFRLFTNYSHVDNGQKMYFIVTFVLYIFNIYQNILTCIKFYGNFNLIHNFFKNSTIFFTYIKQQMDHFLSTTKNYESYNSFKTELIKYKTNIETYILQLKNSQPYKIRHIFKIGKKMKLFYQFKYNQEFIDTCSYSLGFVGYMDNILGLQKNIKERNMTYGKIGKTTKFKNILHPTLSNKNPVKNNIKLDKNYVISGPNASGKTTLLKTVIINTILTQQLYCGFYDKATIKPIDVFHCYLNIPDTNGRDSLFQAEARRCKEILNEINNDENNNENNDGKTHFCIFDELYSGTNPVEAVGSAYSYLKYISTNPNVKFMLTTHFIKLCNLIEDDENISNISNLKMKACIQNNDVKYFYVIEDGISNVKSGFQVLKTLNYPQKILEDVFSFN